METRAHFQPHMVFIVYVFRSYKAHGGSSVGCQWHFVIICSLDAHNPPGYLIWAVLSDEQMSNG